MAQQMQTRLRCVPCAVTPRDRDIPLGDPNPTQGAFRQLPPAWWRTFPAYRRDR